MKNFPQNVSYILEQYEWRAARMRRGLSSVKGFTTCNTRTRDVWNKVYRKHDVGIISMTTNFGNALNRDRMPLGRGINLQSRTLEA